MVKSKTNRFVLKFFDTLIPISAWLVITLPIWLSPFHPAMVAYFIIVFDFYFLYKSFIFTYYATVSYLRLNRFKKIKFAKKLTDQRIGRKISHFVIVPNYKEHLQKLMKTINFLTRADYPYKNIYLVLAFEKREQGVEKKAHRLVNKYKGKFKDIIVTYHPLTQNEVAGKASNQTFAAKVVDRYINEKKIKKDNVLVTICDADSLLPKNYFSYLTYLYLTDPDRRYHFYWAPVLMYNNFWKLPFFVRMQATLSSIIRFAFLSQGENLIQVSTYSTNFWLLKKINFWDVDVIPEDWHIYLQAFFRLGKKVKTLPMYTIVNSDAVYSGNLLKTFTNRYEQEKRWAWGVTDISYCLQMFFQNPWTETRGKMKKIIFLAETHLLWPTSFFILTISASIPPLINPVFKRTVLGFLLPKLAGLILTISSLFLVLYFYLDVELRKKVKTKTKLTRVPLLIIQWYLLPPVSFLLSALPALEAHTRLIVGKKIEYKVTKKA